MNKQTDFLDSNTDETGYKKVVGTHFLTFLYPVFTISSSPDIRKFVADFLISGHTNKSSVFSCINIVFVCLFV
jgi:hypothetical protein